MGSSLVGAKPQHEGEDEGMEEGMQERKEEGETSGPHFFLVATKREAAY